MTKDILLCIRSVQHIQETEESAAEEMEMTLPGRYCGKDGKHYISYEEIQEEGGEPVRSLIKVSESGVEVVKRGPVNVQMIFEKNRKNISCYGTPYGNLMVGIFATNVELDVKEDRLGVNVDYALDVNDGFVADYSISITVRSKECERKNS